MAPPSNRPRPGPALAVLVVLLLLIFGGIAGKATLGKGQYTPKLGLDLAGGTTVTLHAVTPGGKTPPQDQINQAVNIIRQRVNGLGIAEAQVSAQGDSIVVQVPGQGQSKVVKQVGQTARLYFRQVLYAGPGRGTQPTAAPSPSASTTQGTVGQGGKDKGGKGKGGKGAGKKAGGKSGSTIRPSSSTAGRVLNKALESPTANPSGAPTGIPTGAPTAPPTTVPTAPATAPTGLPTTPPTNPSAGDTSGISPELMQQFNALDCSNPKNRGGGETEDSKKQVVACSKDGVEKYVLAPAKVLGTEVTNAQAVTDPQSFGQWKVVLDFNSKGAKQFGDLTTAVNKLQGDRRRVAVELDHVVESVPNIQEPILGGQAEITGQFTQPEAEDLANVLRYGALPLDFEQQAIESVSPTLGRAQLDGGLLAGVLGLALVVVYAFIYYRGLGLVAVFSLASSAALTYGSVVLLSEFIGYRLSLAGIAGLIVAIGITADSFIVYFERLRDEVREGRTLRQATERGWTRARRTILTADTVSVLAALILYIVSVDQVKGFAFTLGLTTIIDIVVVFLFTKPLMTLLVRTRFFGGGHRLSGLDPSRLGARNAARATSRTAVREA